MLVGWRHVSVVSAPWFAGDGPKEWKPRGVDGTPTIPTWKRQARRIAALELGFVSARRFAGRVSEGGDIFIFSSEKRQTQF